MMCGGYSECGDVLSGYMEGNNFLTTLVTVSFQKKTMRRKVPFIHLFLNLTYIFHGQNHKFFARKEVL
jgi:hypothetical protein